MTIDDPEHVSYKGMYILDADNWKKLFISDKNSFDKNQMSSRNDQSAYFSAPSALKLIGSFWTAQIQSFSAIKTKFLEKHNWRKTTFNLSN